MTQNDRDYCKEQLKDYVESITEPSRGSRNQYICPLCESGTGKNRTGAFTIYPDSNRWKCFSCGEGGDVFDLIAHVEGLEKGSREMFKRAEEILLLNETGTGTAETKIVKNKEIKENDVKKPSKAEETERRKYITFSAALANVSNIAKDYLTGERGLSVETINHFKLGFDTDYEVVNSEKWLVKYGYSIIIPYPDENYYIARPIQPPTWFKGKYVKLSGISEPLFNASILYADSTSPVFVTEGQLDAISLFEAGADAIALNGTAGVNKLIKLLQDKPCKRTLALSLDKDENGQKAEKDLAKELGKLGIAYIRYSVSGEHKDPNEALVASREEFIKRVQGVVAVADEVTDIKQEIEQSDREAYIKKHCSTIFIKKFLDEIKANKKIKGISTGFNGLDEILYGGFYAGLYILGAVSSLGKTTFALQIGDTVAKNGNDVLIFSLEMAEKELMAKSLSRLTYSLSPENGLHTRQILNGDFNDPQRESIKNALQVYREFSDNLFVIEGLGSITSESVRKIVDKHIKSTGGRPLVIIDYLQILSPAEPRMNDKQNIDMAVLELKRISRDYNIPVLAISSLNRNSYSKTINMSAFKETGAIEYSSDVLIGLQFTGIDDVEEKEAEEFINTAKNKEVRDIELRILKNRNGITGSTSQFKYNPVYNIFTQGETAKATGGGMPPKRKQAG